MYGLALGYVDLSDHDQLRQDPLLAVLSGKRRVGGARCYFAHRTLRVTLAMATGVMDGCKKCWTRRCCSKPMSG